MEQFIYLVPLDEKSVWVLIGAVVLMLLDVLTGILLAFQSRCYSSSVMREGIYHKISLVLVLLLGWFCDTLMSHVPNLGMPQFILCGVGVLIIFMELTSILENITKMNPEIAEKGILVFFNRVDNAEKNVNNKQ